jgi:hypothetical protein
MTVLQQAMLYASNALLLHHQRTKGCDGCITASMLYFSIINVLKAVMVVLQQAMLFFFNIMILVIHFLLHFYVFHYYAANAFDGSIDRMGLSLGCEVAYFF